MCRIGSLGDQDIHPEDSGSIPGEAHFVCVQPGVNQPTLIFKASCIIPNLYINVIYLTCT